MSPGLLDTPTLLRRNLVFGELGEDVMATVAEHMDLLTVRGGGLLFAANVLMTLHPAWFGLAWCRGSSPTGWRAAASPFRYRGDLPPQL